VRSLKQARYTRENLGHYGLAAKSYCHFTSPIRRYPDLMVHRLVKHRLEKGRWQRLPWVRELESTATHCSERERRAVAVERRVVDIKKSRYMAARVGEVFEGVISSATRFGLFVELKEIGFDGLLHADNLPGNVVFDERHMALIVGRERREFRVGMPLKVRVEFADPLAGRVTLGLAED